MGVSSITFTSTAPTGRAGAMTGTTLDSDLGVEDFQTRKEGIPGWGYGKKELGPGSGRAMWFDVLVSEATVATCWAKIDGWMALKGGSGTLAVTQNDGDHVPGPFQADLLAAKPTKLHHTKFRLRLEFVR